MTTHEATKQQIITSLDALPEAQLVEVADFVEFLRRKYAAQPAAYVPVALGGFLADTVISDDDLADVRREMWRAFEERDQ